MNQMRKGDVKIFADRQKLSQMVNLRRIGWAESSLALLFGCNIEPISTKCKRYRIKPLDNTYTFERIALKAMPVNENKTRWRISGGENLCMGRSYKDYFS